MPKAYSYIHSPTEYGGCCRAPGAGAGCAAPSVKLSLIPTADMCADMMTKSLDDATFRRHRDRIMNVGASSRITGAHS